MKEGTTEIGFYFQDRGFNNIDLRTPNKGSNGVGGTQYSYAMVANALLEYSEKFNIAFYHYNEQLLPKGIRSVIVKESTEILKKAEEDGIEVFVFTALSIKELEGISTTSIKCIAWAHNYILSDIIELLQNTVAVKRLVFVGKEQYDRYIDHDIIKKSTFIYNMFDGTQFDNRDWPIEPVVTYTGALMFNRGFHVLAKVWKDIVKEVPNARLNVIGSIKLYNNNAKTGSFGLADKDYEDLFLPYLMENEELMPSVNFSSKNAPTTATEKIDIYSKTMVGVVNPSGKNETFGISAVEMSACGIPVVASSINGFFDTIVDKKTGYLIKNAKGLRKKIVRLLKQQELNQRMGHAGKIFAEREFAPSRIIKQWLSLLDDVLQEKQSVYMRPTRNYTSDLKWVRIIIRFMRLCRIPIKPLINFESYVYKFFNRKRLNS
ncbi:MAG: glycosyltransferase family 4 protein [Defluviitaleaceae bacterium]|nr:glycosyltransferase family 4 protein [Defluviitaleaceae bacterium]